MLIFMNHIFVCILYIRVYAYIYIYIYIMKYHMINMKDLYKSKKDISPKN